MEENVIQIKSEIMINVDSSVKNIVYVKKIIFGILLHALASIIDDSVITRDEIIEETKPVPINFNEKKQPIKHKISIFYLNFC